MTRSTSLRVAVIMLAVLLIPGGAASQSGQKFSFQASALVSSPFGGGLEAITTGPGWEAQLRWNRGRVSWGAGIEQTFHDIENTAGRTVKMTGGFVESRYVIDVGSDAAAPYLAGRFAVSQIFVEEGTETSSALGITVNGGGGVLVNLGSALNLDLGVTMGWKSLGRATISETVFDLGTGGNLIARAGLALGIGG